MKPYTAYLTRICAALEREPEAKGDDRFSDGFNRALFMVASMAKLRDPVLDPVPGDIIRSASMFGGAGADVIVKRLLTMRHRGNKGNLRRLHVAVEIVPADGRRIERRGRTYTLEGFGRLCADGVVMHRGAVPVARTRRV